MKKPNAAYQPSEAELEILQVLWDKEPATVREVHEILSQHKEVGYTTTLKQMQRMLDKGMLKRKALGKQHYYSTTAREAEVKGNLFERFLNTAFKGSAMDLVMHALGQAEADQSEIAALEEWLEKQKEQHNHE